MVAKQLVKYEAENQVVHGLLLDPDRAAVAGAEPAGAIGSPIRASVSKGNREHGLRPRGVRLVRTIGTAPDTFKRYSFLPVLTITAYASAAFNVGTVIQIDGIDWTISAKVGEDY